MIDAKNFKPVVIVMHSFLELPLEKGKFHSHFKVIKFVSQEAPLAKINHNIILYIHVYTHTHTHKQFYATIIVVVNISFSSRYQGLVKNYFVSNLQIQHLYNSCTTI